MDLLKTLLLSLLGYWGYVSGQGEDDVKLEYMRFDLYTRNNKQGQRLWSNDSESVINSFYRTDRPTKLITHRLWSYYIISDESVRIKDAYLNRSEEYNVIIVDWREVVHQSDLSIKVLKQIARYQARMIDLLVRLGSSSRNISLVGMNEGAFVASLATRTTKNKVGHFVALNPPDQKSIEREINANLHDALTLNTLKNDADFIEIVYTADAVSELLGHATYYVNGGQKKRQYCEVVADSERVCSFLSVSELFAEAIEQPDMFVARKCQDYKSFSAGKCNDNKFVSFPNSLIEKKEEGTYYLRTSFKIPYGLGQDGASVLRLLT